MGETGAPLSPPKLLSRLSSRFPSAGFTVSCCHSLPPSPPPVTWLLWRPGLGACHSDLSVVPDSSSSFIFHILLGSHPSSSFYDYIPSYWVLCCILSSVQTVPILPTHSSDDVSVHPEKTLASKVTQPSSLFQLSFLLFHVWVPSRLSPSHLTSTPLPTACQPCSSPSLHWECPIQTHRLKSQPSPLDVSSVDWFWFPSPKHTECHLARVMSAMATWLVLVSEMV